VTRRIIIHSLADARAALAAAAAAKVPVILASAEGAAAYAGAMWFRAVVERACAEFPKARITAVLDCADEGGMVLNAFRHGFTNVRFTGNRAALHRLGENTATHGATIETGQAPPALDLRDECDPETACQRYLRNVKITTKTPRTRRR